MKSNLETIARVLGFSALFGAGIILIWWGIYLTGWFCSLRMFNLTPHECALITFSGIGLMKLMVLTFFLIPWIAIRLELRRQNRKSRK